MNLGMVIPTFWDKKKGEFAKSSIIYDHPTPLDCKGGLEKTIKSISTLDDLDFELIVVVCPTTSEISRAAQKRVETIVKRSKPVVKTRIFSYKHIQKLKKIVKKKSFKKFFRLDGYPNVRNTELIISNLLGKDTIVLIDDDEVFSNPSFIKIVKNALKKKVKGFSGYYTKKGKWKKKEKPYPWSKFFPKRHYVNMQLKKLVGKTNNERIVPTTFALGGCMTITKDIFLDTPFDPLIPRGEDIDYVINSLMRKKKFYFNNQLSMEHLQPPTLHPYWQYLRSDSLRFVYEYKKISTQTKIKGWQSIKPAKLDVYPGKFLQKDCINRFIKANLLLKQYFKSKKKFADARETQKTILMINKLAESKENYFLKYVSLQRNWKSMMQSFNENNKLKEKFENTLPHIKIY